MNYKRLLASSAALCIACSALSSASPFSAVPSVYAEESDIAGTVELVNIGSSRRITFTNTTETPTWYSDNTGVATVSADGTVTATGEGTAYVYAVFSTQVLKFKTVVTIEKAPEVTEVNLGTITLTNEANAYRLSLTNVPADAQITWTSTDTSVATVDSTGLVVAVSSGKCKVIAVINGISYITDVVSEYVPKDDEKQEDVILGSMELTAENPSGKVELSGVPEGAEIVWSSTDESVATVDRTGIVTAVSSGECQVIALINGVKCIMNVTSTYTPGENIVINGGDFTIDGIGKKLQLSVSNTDETAKWLSMNVNVATVDENGLVTAVGEGEAVILAQFSNKVCKVTVKVTAGKSDILYGDANANGTVEVADAVFILQGIADPGNEEFYLTEEGAVNANCKNPTGSGVDSEDALAIQQYKVSLISALPVE